MLAARPIAVASTALAEGVPISGVSRWLGRKSITTTVDLYGHLVPEASGRARDALDRALAHSGDLPPPLAKPNPAAGHGHVIGVSRPVGRVLCREVSDLGRCTWSTV
jgi:hypothetical protein